MSRGIKITVKTFKDVREPRKDDVRVRIWTGIRWACLCWRSYTPYMAGICKTTPHELDIPVEFLTPDVVPHDRLVYVREVMPLFKNGPNLR